jgi:3-methyl-2-oxobutanoate hydroxymethyltransferase
MKKVTVNDIKKSEKNITCLTCYDYLTARVMDRETDLDMILVGDSLGMVVLGYEKTVPVTVEDMIHHTAAVGRGVERVFLVADFPYLEIARSIDRVVESSRRLMQEGGAEAVKIEGAGPRVEKIKYLVDHDVPVVGHLGLTPQSVDALGGYGLQANGEESIRKLGRDARELEEAGVLGVVLECVPSEVAGELTKILSIPTIGIGAGPRCNGQVLVWQDMMGLTGEKTPSFVRKWGDMKQMLREGVNSFCSEVRVNSFPSTEESFSLPEKIDSEKLSDLLQQ